MKDYTKLVVALRCNGTSMNGSCVGKKCGYYADGFCESMRMHADAAAAIEEMQAEIRESMQKCAECGDEQGQKVKELQDVLKEADKKQEYQHDCICELTAENEELKAEVKRLEPKRGEWIEDTTTYAGPGLSNYKCSLCGKICGTWRSGLKPSELPNWCGNCGADMRNMEAQDGEEN